MEKYARGKKAGAVQREKPGKIMELVLFLTWCYNQGGNFC